MTRRGVGTGFAAVALGFSLAARADTIVRTNGETIQTGGITEATWNEIRYTAASGQPARVQAADVESLEISRGGDVFQSAEAARARESFDEAIEKYRRVLARADTPALVKDACAYGVGLCLLRKGSFPEAITAFGALETQNPNSFYTPQAKLRRAEAMVAAGQLDEAVRAYDAIGVTYGERVAALASYGKAEVLSAQGKREEAARAFEGVADARSVAYPALALRARLLAARLRADLGQTDVAERHVSSAEGSSALDRSGQMVLSNVRAQLRLAQAEQAENPAEQRIAYLDALWMYLGTAVLYADGSQEEAVALRGAIACAQKLGEGAKAQQLEAELRSRFPGAR